MNEQIKQEIIAGVVEMLKNDPWQQDKLYAQLIANNPRRQTVIKIGDNLTIGLTMFCTILLTFIVCFIFVFMFFEDWRQKDIAGLQQKQAELFFWREIHRAQIDQLGGWVCKLKR